MNESVANVWKFYIYQFFSSFQLTVPIFALFLLANDLTMTGVMILQSIFTFLIFTLEIPSGVLADSLGRRKTLVLAAFFLSLTYFIFGFGASFRVFAVAQIAHAIAQSLKSGADQAFLYDSLLDKELTNQYASVAGRASALEMLTLGLGALAGGYVASVTSYRFVFFITAGIAFGSLLTGLAFSEPKQRRSVIGEHPWDKLKRATRFTVSNPRVRKFASFFAILGAFAYMLYIFIQPFFDNANMVYGKSLAVAAYFIVTSFGALSAEKFIDTVNTEKLFVILSGVSAAAFLGLGLSPILIALAFVAINSFVMGVSGVFAHDGINAHTDSDIRASVLSVMNMGEKALHSILAPVFGYVADAYSLNVVFILSGFTIACVAIFFLAVNIVGSMSQT